MMDLVVLRDGLMVHEVDAVCDKLQAADIGFKVERVTAKEAGIIESHKNNWATGLVNVVNYFNHGGTAVYMRIAVAEKDVERANAALEPKPRGPLDKMTVVIWVIVGLAAALFAYAFICPESRERERAKSYMVD